MVMDEIDGFIDLTDVAGCRHLIRINSISCISDMDLCQADTMITVSGRTVCIPRPLTEIRELIACRIRRTSMTARNRGPS